jgi:hypothetical protein
VEAAAASPDRIAVIVSDQAPFFKWSEFLLLPQNIGGASQLCVVPKASGCFQGPRLADKS